MSAGVLLIQTCYQHTDLFMKCLKLECLTNTDVSSDSADVEIGDLFLPDQLLHVGLAKLLVVKEGRVGINVRVETLLDSVAIWVDLGNKGIFICCIISC